MVATASPNLTALVLSLARGESYRISLWFDRRQLRIAFLSQRLGGLNDPATLRACYEFMQLIYLMFLIAVSRKPYPSDVSEEEWHFVAPF